MSLFFLYYIGGRIGPLGLTLNRNRADEGLVSVKILTLKERKMLDLKRLQSLRLRRIPWGQLLTANLGMRPNFTFLPGIDIVVEGLENLPTDRRVILALNHTDRYNPWPLQYTLYRKKLGFTVTWVKAKYYEHWFIGAFMTACNNIPLPSRGYVISTEFRKLMNRPPSNDEYRTIRDMMDGKRDFSSPFKTEDTEHVRRFFEGGSGSVQETVRKLEEYFGQMMDVVTNLSTQVMSELNSHLLVCPQGTRSKRLTEGKTGMVQMAQRMGATILPVGCSGSDRLYPGASPFAKKGRVVYRIGEPLPVDSGPLAPHRVPEEIKPFTREGSEKFGEKYTIMTKIVMDRINDLVDPEYQYGDDEQGVSKGVKRFV